jgi:hypothetical protein
MEDFITTEYSMELADLEKQLNIKKSSFAGVATPSANSNSNSGTNAESQPLLLMNAASSATSTASAINGSSY